MKQISFLFTFIFSFIATSQQIENVNYFLEDKNIVITYDFVNCVSSEVYDISVLFIEQNQTKISPISLSGDVKNVICGSNRIVWDILKDGVELYGKYQVWLDFKVASKSIRRIFSTEQSK